MSENNENLNKEFEHPKEENFIEKKSHSELEELVSPELSENKVSPEPKTSSTKEPSSESTPIVDHQSLPQKSENKIINKWKVIIPIIVLSMIIGGLMTYYFLNTDGEIQEGAVQQNISKKTMNRNDSKVDSPLSNELSKDTSDSIKVSIKPILNSKELIHDFGEILEGKKVTHTFELENISKESAKIENTIASSRSITVSNIKGKKIQPGEKIKLDITFNSRKRRGHQTKTVKVITSKSNMDFLITVHARVMDRDMELVKNSTLIEPTVETVSQELDPFILVSKKGTDESFAKLRVEEHAISFGKIKEGTIETKTIDFYNKGNEELIIQGVKTSCPCLTVIPSLNKLLPGEKADLKLRYDSRERVGKQAIRITISANTDPKKTILTWFGEVEK